MREDIGHLRFETNMKKRFDKYSGNYMDKDEMFRLAAILIDDDEIINRMDVNFIETVEMEVLPQLMKKHNMGNLVKSNVEQKEISIINN